MLRYLAEHGPSETNDLVRAIGSDPASRVAVREMTKACDAMRHAGLLMQGRAETTRGLWRLRDGHRLCPCGSGLMESGS